MKKAIVIGASSIGRELALLLAAEGYSMGIIERKLEQLTEFSDKNQEVL